MLDLPHLFLRPNLRDLLIRGETTLRQAMTPPCQYAGGVSLIGAGEESNTVYLLESGWVTRTRYTNGRRRQIVSILLPGDLIGSKSIFLERQPDTFECLTEVQVCAIDQRCLLELIGHDLAVTVRIMFELAEHERRLQNLRLALGKGRADERMAALLLDLYRRLNWLGAATDNRFWMPMTQSEIADHLGLSTEHVNRVLRRLRESRIVTVYGGLVTINNMNCLLRLVAPLQDVAEHAEPMPGG